VRIIIQLISRTIDHCINGIIDQRSAPTASVAIKPTNLHIYTPSHLKSRLHLLRFVVEVLYKMLQNKLCNRSKIS